MEVTLDNMDMLRSVADQKIVDMEGVFDTRDIALTIELIFNPNRVTERILP